MLHLSDDDLTLLAERLTQERVPEPDPAFDPATAEPPPPAGDPVEYVDWNPDYNDTQERAAYDSTSTILLVGEKGSGKTFCGLSILVQHCYDNENALAVIVATTLSQAGHGALYELESVVLPKFAYGNPYPPWNLDGSVNPDGEAGLRRDGGIGLEYTDTKPDPISKDRYLYIKNRFGSWSMVLIKSILFPQHVKPRFTGITPSFIYVEEITETTAHDYFTYLSMQLGRRQRVKGPQQYVASCNPKGPSHWVYETFHVDKAIENDTEHPAPGFAVYHIPLHENLLWINPEYRTLLDQRLRDPIDRMRLIDGIWIDQPSGEAIFKDVWMENIHVAGEETGSGCIIPVTTSPVVLGWDPGPANFSVHFLQPLFTADGVLWTVFDEVNLVGMRWRYREVVKRVMSRMDYWEAKAGIEAWNHVIDEAAFNQRNSRGSFDSTEIMEHADSRIVLHGCPKGNDSVPARVREVRELLLDDMILVSSICRGTKKMFLYLESEPAKEGKYDPNLGFIPRRSPFIHPFDSLSYPIHYYKVHPAARYWRTSRSVKITPEIYRAGAR